MRLKRLEISGFKSFAKSTTLVFDTPITSIVGPNGSGKSNIAEALRWVLGEQSMKSLRGKRGEDLIFNGAGATSRLNRASVTLVFDNSERALDLAFDEVAVTREVYRDGSNSYLINGSQVRLRDIVEMLSAVSLGPSGHHIISQGEADRVLNANLRERREILEDALGLKIFQYKLNESKKRLEKTKENVAQVESLRREIAPHLKFLKKQVEEVEKVASLKDELRQLCVQYFKTESGYLDSEKKSIENDKHIAKAELEKVERELVICRQALEEADSNKGVKNPRVNELEQNISETLRKRDELSREVGRLEGRIDSIKVDQFVIVESTSGKESCKYCGQEIVRKGGEPNTSGHAEAERKELLDNKQNLESEIKKFIESERKYIDELDTLRSALSAKTDEAREALRKLYESKNKQALLNAELEKVEIRESGYKNEHETFARDAHEVSLLVGVNILSESSNDVVGASVSRQQQADLRRRLERIKIKVEDAGGVGTDVLREYDDTKARDLHLEKELADLEASAKALADLSQELRDTLEIKFKEGLKLVNTEFNQFFNTLFGGGSASVRVEELARPAKVFIDGEEFEPDEFDGAKSAIGGSLDATAVASSEWGIDVNVSLPRKKIKGLEMLSGGERALTSIALLFAMSQVNPPPFLVLDETDAALDEANSKKYGEMLTTLSTKSQLIVVTHNRETMAHAQVLYGVTMGADGVSKLLSIRFDDAVTFAK